MFADDANRIKLKGYVSTDIYAQKEFFKKRVFLSSAVSNLFNTSYKSNPSVTWGGWTRVGSPKKNVEADHWRGDQAVLNTVFLGIFIVRFVFKGTK